MNDNVFANVPNLSDDELEKFKAKLWETDPAIRSEFLGGRENFEAYTDAVHAGLISYQGRGC